jgi:hypothetical protein
MEIMRTIRHVSPGVALLAACLVPALPAGAADWSLSAGMDYSNGRYGGGQATETWSVPLILKWEGERSTLKITLPWVRVTTPSGGNIIDVDPGGQPVYDGSGPRSTEEGMGDLGISYAWSVWPRPLYGFLLDLGAKAKLATADKAKGLGSGKNDYSVQADMYYLVGALTPFFTAGYRMPGDPAGLSLRNQRYGTLGLGYKLSSADSAGLMWDWRQASRTGSEGAKEATIYWVRKFSPDFKLQTYALRGFSAVSPDWGFGFLATYAY